MTIHHQFEMVRTLFMVIGKVTQANRLRVIGNSETFSAVTKYINPKKVEAVLSIRRGAKSPRYEKKALFDFMVFQRSSSICSLYSVPR